MMRLGCDMKLLRRALRNSVFALLVAIFVCWPVRNVKAGDQEMIKFRWAFGALKQSETELRLEALGSNSVLKTGDQLKMMVELQSGGFVYVIHHNPQDEVKLLFPYTLKQLSTDYQQQRKYYIPEGDRWFELDQHVGRETFYLLASAKRLESLEELFERYENVEPPRKGELTRQVLDEVRDFKKQHRELTAAAERPETIGGAVRGFEKAQGMNRPDIAAIATEISAPGFVTRTFTIDHQ
jgi:hypothetical protein